MDIGNNITGKTAPERYVSGKSFEELPDAFRKLAELLSEDQFELVAINENYVCDGEIRLVYLMNDAVESFLVFGNARMTGVYKPDYEGRFCRLKSAGKGIYSGCASGGYSSYPVF